MYVVGTAGHVDHGKSSLVRAISGINPDRLREEQVREMTIDLGFAWVALPSGREISIVDVPGHEDFIRNMLAGVGGIDLAILVVAADEAVMPQTREHLAILDLLRVPRGVVALTKADLIEDPDWLDLVAEEVRDAIRHSTLADAPIIPVSVVTGMGLEQLLSSIDTLLDQAQPRADQGQPRLPIDRVFTISGFGTVVTGTLLGGHLDVGDAVEIVPGGRTARVRGLQSHKSKLDHALPGTRVAVNLTGIEVADLSRGQVVTRPGTLAPTTLIDVRLEAVRDVPWPIRHGMAVELFTGAASTLGRVRLLEADLLEPAESGWAQVQLEAPLAIVRNDRFVLRMPSPSVTLGGGRVVDAHPIRRHRRFDAAVLKRLQVLYDGDSAGLLLALLGEGRPLSGAELLRQSQLEVGDAEQALGQLVQRGEAIALDELPSGERWERWPGLLVSRGVWDAALQRARMVLGEYHASQPLRAGMSREEFRNRLGLRGDWAGAFLVRAAREGLLRIEDDLVALPEHGVVLSVEDHRRIQRLMEMMAQSPYAPPGWSEVEAAVGVGVAQHLVDSGRLVRLTDSVVFEAPTLDAMIVRLRDTIGQGNTFTVAQARDLFGTSRKYIVAFLEELDRRRITRRIGDERVIR